MRTPNESKSPPITPSQENQPPVQAPQISQNPLPVPVSVPEMPTTTASQQPNPHAPNAAMGKYDESILFQLQRAPPSSTMSSIRSSSMMILAGTQSQHQKEDSLIDLNEDSSYMRQSQPMPDQLRQNSRIALKYISFLKNIILKKGYVHLKIMKKN